MKQKQTKYIKLLAILFLVCIILPVIFYIINFGHYEFSDKVDNWADFSSYIGGILSPIIAIFTTIILGYLTYQVSQNNSEDNLNLFKLEQKLKAYQEIAQITSEFDMALNKMKIYNDLMIKVGQAGNKEAATEQYIKAMESIFTPISNLKVKTTNFPINYGHLFNYDFDSDEYKKLVDRSYQYFNSMDILKDFDKGNLDFDQRDLLNDLKVFLSKLRKELKNN